MSGVLRNENDDTEEVYRQSAMSWQMYHIGQVRPEPEKSQRLPFDQFDVNGGRNHKRLSNSKNDNPDDFKQYGSHLSPQPGNKISNTQPRVDMPKIGNLKMHNYDKEN